MAEELPIMQSSSFLNFNQSTMDGYIKIMVGNKPLRTKVVTLESGSNQIEWN